MDEGFTEYSTNLVEEYYRQQVSRKRLENNPAELRRSILRFLGADPDKPGGRLDADYNSWTRMEKLRLTDGVRAHLAKAFKKELKICAAQLGGPAREWPARYGF